MSRYPYYCLRTSDTQQFPNQRGFGDYNDFIEGTDPKKKERKEFFELLSEQYTNLNAKNPTAWHPIEDLRAQAKSWFDNTAKALPAKWHDYNNQAWMGQQIESAWGDSLSPMYQKGPSPTNDRRAVQTNHIVIKSRYLDTEDGGIRIHFPGIVVDGYPTPVAKAAVSTAQAKSPSKTGAAQLFADIPSSLLATATNPPPAKIIREPGDESDTEREDVSSPLAGLIERIFAGTPTTGYWFASTKVQPGESIRVLAAGPLNDFVTILHNYMFGVTSEPDPSSTTAFIAEDEWYSWLSDAVSATSFEMKSDATSNPEGFVLHLNWPGGEADQTSLRFDTDFVAAAFTIPPESTPAIGLLGDTNVMVLGLDNAQKVTISSDLTAVLEYAGLKELTGSPLTKALGPFVKLSMSSDKSTGARNAVWFEPGQAYRTTVRLQWDFDDLSTVNEFFDFIKSGITLRSAHVITRRISSWQMSSEGGFKVVTAGEATVAVKLDVGDKLQFIGSLTFGEDKVTVTLTALNNVFKELVDWLAAEVGADIPIVQWLTSAADTLFSTFLVRRLSLEVSTADGKRKVTGWSLDVEISLKVAGGATVLVTYTSEPSRLRGELWFRPPNPFPPLLLPQWEESQELVPISAAQQESLDLSKLTPDGVSNIPKQIPTNVEAARLQIDQEAISFYGLITCNDPSGTETIPPVRLDRVELSSTYTYGGSGKGKLQLALNFDVVLTPPPGSDPEDPEDDPEPTTLAGGIDYNAGDWTLTASMTPLDFATIYEFFDPQAQDEVLTVLGKIQVFELDLVYNYKSGVGSDFKFEGILLLGELELQVKYNYTPEGWTLDAILGATTEGATLGGIIEGISGEKDILPSFIGDIPVAGVEDGGAVRISCTRVGKKDGKISVGGKKEDSYLFFTASVKINIVEGTAVEATYMQYRDLSWPTTAPAKRVLKASVIGLPSVTIPVIGDLTQPFDEMFYMWVQDKQPQATTKKLPGLADKEVQYINKALTPDESKPPIDELIFKDSRKTKNDTDVVIPAGSHFVLVLKFKDKRSVIVDYNFNAEKKEKQQLEFESTKVAFAEGDADSGSGSSTLAPYKKTVGKDFSPCDFQRVPN